MDVLATIKALHASEINGGIEWFYDSDWTWTLGDEMNGEIATGSAFSIEEAVEALATKACELFPTSVFAKSRQAAA